MQSDTTPPESIPEQDPGFLIEGAEIERYIVECFIGRGGMGAVYRARHKTLGTLHAIKVLAVAAPHIRERLVQEGRLQARLRHPSVVNVTDVLDVQGAPALVMDYVDGPSLEAWLRQVRPSTAQAELIFMGILSAVERAHALDIVHRDLKPANVMLDLSEGFPVPKVTDFGLAKALREDSALLHRTRSGMPFGTPSYMAPEQIREASRVDLRADIFALGTILYELLCARRAFEGRDLLEVLNAAVEGRFIHPRSILPELPQRLEAAILGCLVVDREARIPSCAVLREIIAGKSSWDAPYSLVPAPAMPPVTAAAPALQSGGRETLVQPVVAQTLPASPNRTGLIPLVAAVFFGVLVLGIGGVLLAVSLLRWGGSEPESPTVATVTEPAPTALDPVATSTSTPTSEPIASATPVAMSRPKSATTSEKRLSQPAVTEPTPQPVATAPTTAVAAKSSEESAPEMGMVTFEGARSVTLESASKKRLPAGRVPVGRYTIHATFDGGRTVPAGEVTVRGGAAVHLKCDGVFFLCKPGR